MCARCAFATALALVGVLSEDLVPILIAVVYFAVVEFLVRRQLKPFLSGPRQVTVTMTDELETSGWYSDGWLDQVLDQAAHNFDEAAARWRNLYRSALNQQKAQKKDNLLLCWRTSLAKSVITVAVSLKGHPKAADSVAKIDEQWGKLG